jgi:SnoaL-like domain
MVTVTLADVATWLDRYIVAWRSNDRADILALFAPEATYSYGPYRDPIRGREAIADSWLSGPDESDSWEADYRALAVNGDLAVVHGRSRYFESDRARLRTEYDNIFVIRFDAAGRCVEFAEWFMEKPAG